VFRPKFWNAPPGEGFVNGAPLISSLEGAETAAAALVCGSPIPAKALNGVG
jgi:hypothetical protein